MAMAGCELDIVNSDQLNTTNMWVDESDVTGATTGIYFEGAQGDPGGRKPPD